MKPVASTVLPLSLVLASCGHPYAGPDADASAQPADVAGCWRGRACLDATLTVELTLRPDGTYVYGEIQGGQVIGRGRGSWWLQGGYLSLSGREWSGYASSYWGAWGKGPAGFMLFGGSADCRDPDSYDILGWYAGDELTNR